MSKLKPKILIIADHPGIPSGVGTMNAIIIQHLVKKGFDIVCMAGAVKHPNYQIQNLMGAKIYPVNVYGTPDDLRSIMQLEKPDMVFLFTDPRYFEWVWNMEDEIRNKIPIFYYHVWDCDPIPQYNRQWYESCDHISCISKLSYKIVSSFDVSSSYVPHGINEEIYKPIEDKNLIKQQKNKVIGNKYEWDDDTFIIFWNNRNIRRKIPGQVMKTFAEFNKKVDNAILVMHTNVVDGEGTDLYAIKRDLYPDSKIVFNDCKVDQSELNLLYNMSDVTINISFNEGFGLATLESMAAGTPILVTMTGGLQDQINFEDEKGNKLKSGIGMKPGTRTIVGSPPTPYIHDDRVSEETAVKALMKIYKMSKEEREQLSNNARKNVVMHFTAQQMAEGIEKDIKHCLENFKPRDRFSCAKVI